MDSCTPTPNKLRLKTTREHRRTSTNEFYMNATIVSGSRLGLGLDPTCFTQLQEKF
jgi:hypothetical protein